VAGTSPTTSPPTSALALRTFKTRRVSAPLVRSRPPLALVTRPRYPRSLCLMARRRRWGRRGRPARPGASASSRRYRLGAPCRRGRGMEARRGRGVRAHMGPRRCRFEKPLRAGRHAGARRRCSFSGSACAGVRSGSSLCGELAHRAFDRAHAPETGAGCSRRAPEPSPRRVDRTSSRAAKTSC
jgi:hypothetical protein